MPTQNLNHELELSIYFISVSLEVLAYVEKFNRHNSFGGAGSPIKSVFESGAQIRHAPRIKFTSQLLVPAVELKFQDAHLLVFQTVCSILKGKVDANIGLRLSRRKAQEQSSKR